MSLPLALAVTAQGHVLATDVDERLVPLLQDRARSEGLVQLEAVRVGDGLDPIYRGRTFDRIVMCSVIEYLAAPDAFLRGLQAHLRADSGRLAIVQGRTDPLYFAADFETSFRLERLVAEGPKAPLGRRLDPAIWHALAAHASAQPVGLPLPATLTAPLAAAFNRWLADPQWTRDLAAGSPDGTLAPLLAALGDDDRALAQWLLQHEGQVRGLPAVAERVTRTMNWTLLLPWFRDALPREIYPRGIYLTPEGIVRRMQALGYRLERRVTGLPGHDMLIFVR
jgi:hypothetical protein